jgi:hypothetical protein
MKAECKNWFPFYGNNTKNSIVKFYGSLTNRVNYAVQKRKYFKNKTCQIVQRYVRKKKELTITSFN